MKLIVPLAGALASFCAIAWGIFVYVRERCNRFDTTYRFEERGEQRILSVGIRLKRGSAHLIRVDLENNNKPKRLRKILASCEVNKDLKSNETIKVGFDLSLHMNIRRYSIVFHSIGSAAQSFSINI